MAKNKRTETQRQFWRESEGRWVDHVMIHRDEIDKRLKWRHRVITTTTKIGSWQDRKN